MIDLLLNIRNYEYIIFIIGFFLSLLLLYVFIRVLNKVKLGQAIRKLGPKSHQIKSGTPNIGGTIMIGAILLLFALYLFLKISSINEFNLDIYKLLMLFAPLIMYGSLGFIDDMIKAKSHKNDGLSPTVKLIFQIFWAALYFFIFLKENNTIINIFGYLVDLKWMYGLFIVFCFVGGSNAFNLVDGLDGLATGLAIIILSFLLFISNNLTVSFFIIGLIATLSAFLIFNFHPAKIFMGDSGSLAIGSTIVNLFIILKIEFLLVIFGFVMIIETLSVIIQVLYYKKTKKRVFLMTPLHHHFELKGIKEEKVAIGFWIIQFIFGLIGLYIYYSYY